MYICFIITFLFAIYSFFIAYHRVRHIIKLIKTGQLDVHNSPFDRLASFAARSLACSRGFCNVAALIVIAYGTLASLVELNGTIKEMNEEAKIIRDSIYTLEEILSMTQTKFMDDLGNYYSLLIDFLNTLTLNQLQGFLHLCFIISLFIFVFNLATIFYGESLIKYFDLPKKFPRFAHLIQLRSKFQQYYFAINLILIIIILIILTYVKVIILFQL